MEEVELPPMEMFRALFQHRVNIQYSKFTDDLTVCPVDGPFKGKCLIRLGLAQMLEAEIFIENGVWRVEGELRNFSQRYAEGLKTFNPAKRYQPLVATTKSKSNTTHYAEVLVFKDELYIRKNGT